MKSLNFNPPSSFDAAALIGRGRTLAARGGDGNEHDKLVKQTEKWVSQTFYGTLLKQMRQSPFHSDLMDGGNGGKMFASMLDQHLADHMSRHAGGKLVRAVVRKIEAGQAAKRYAKASKPRLPAPAHSHSATSKLSSSLNPAPRPQKPAPNSDKLHKLNVHMETEHA